MVNAIAMAVPIRTGRIAVSSLLGLELGSELDLATYEA
jgi:hypothetical protein